MGLDQRPLVEGDLDQMWEIEREAFHADPAHLDWWRRSECEIGVHRVEGLFLDGRLIATSGVLPLGQWFGGRSVQMGGVRAVAVRPEHRGRGHAARVVRASLAAMRARGEVISALYPQVVRPYRSLGWEVAGTIVFRQVPPRALGAIATPDLPVRRARAVDHDTIRACYSRVARETNGWVDRPDGRWKWILDRFSDDYFFVAGEEGYVLYRVVDKPPAGPEGFRLLVLDLVAVSPEAFRALWALLGAASSVVPNVFFRGGPSDPLSGLLDGLDVSVSRERPWMLRLVDVAAAMAARGYANGVRATVPLEIADPDCPWNAGRYTLVVEGGAGRLEPGGSGAIRLDIGPLASLYSGYTTTAALARTGRLAGGSAEERAALDGIFAGPMPWMIDEF